MPQPNIRRTGLLQWRVPQMCEIPLWLGIAWQSYATREHVCYPLPLNWLARWTLVGWEALATARGGRTYEEKLIDMEDQCLKDAYDRGHEAGFREGQRALRESILEDIRDRERDMERQTA